MERAIDRDEDDLVLCLLMSESKKECKNTKVWFAEEVKQPLEAGMMCTIDGDTFSLFTKNTWIGDSGASSMTILAYMTSPTSMSQTKVAPMLCLL